MNILNCVRNNCLNTSSVVGFTTSFDRSSNKFFERHLHAESRSQLYEPFANFEPQGGYDSIDRLRQYQRGVLTSAGGHNNLGGGGIETPISLPNTDQSRTYDLDGLGNWRRTTFEPVGGSQTTEVRQHNALNQITKRDATPLTYDLNGNLLDDGTRLYTWDAFNRLANVRRKSDGSLIGDYAYDATARRIRKVVSNGGLSGAIPNGTTHYLYTAWQCLEECDGFGSPVKQYVWGIYIDELLQQRHLATINNHGAGDYYPVSDLLYRTTALTDSAANIIETYDTDAYGNTLIFTAPGTGNNWWADDTVPSDNPTCQFIFSGRRDAETMLFYYRRRYFDASFGRFISRDPRVLGIGQSQLSARDLYDRNIVQRINRLRRGATEIAIASFVGVYEYTEPRPVTSLDPIGLEANEFASPVPTSSGSPLYPVPPPPPPGPNPLCKTVHQYRVDHDCDIYPCDCGYECFKTAAAFFCVKCSGTCGHNIYPCKPGIVIRPGFRAVGCIC